MQTKILKYLQGRIYWLEDEIKQKKKIIEVCSLEEDKQMWLGYVKDYEKELELLMIIHRIVQRYFLVEEECFETNPIKEVTNNE